MVLVPAAEGDRGLDAEMLRQHRRRLGLALVVSHGVQGPDSARDGPEPAERGGAELRVF